MMKAGFIEILDLVKLYDDELSAEHTYVVYKIVRHFFKEPTIHAASIFGGMAVISNESDFYRVIAK